MPKRVRNWILAFVMFAAICTAAALLIPHRILQSPFFFPLILLLIISTRYFTRQRIAKRTISSVALRISIRSRNWLIVLGLSLIACAPLWVTASLIWLRPSVGDTVIPFSVLLLSGWLFLVNCSTIVQQNANKIAISGVVFFVCAAAWLVLSAGTLNSGDLERFPFVFFPSLALFVAGVLLLLTPVFVWLIRSNQTF